VDEKLNPSTKPSIAVLQFIDLSNDPSQQYLAEGMTAIICENLSGIRSLQVKSAFSTDGEFDRAFAEYDKALEINPNNSDLLVTKGAQLSISGRFGDGLKLAMDIKNPPENIRIV
jgi:TolB-like protein